MIRRGLFGFYSTIGRVLHHPWHVLWVCLGLTFFNCVLDGSLLRLWAFHRDQKELRIQASALRLENTKVKELIKKTSDPNFMEREARDRFDLVEDGDLVFVFSQDN